MTLSYGRVITSQNLACIWVLIHSVNSVLNTLIYKWISHKERNLCNQLLQYWVLDYAKNTVMYASCGLNKIAIVCEELFNQICLGVVVLTDIHTWNWLISYSVRQPLFHMPHLTCHLSSFQVGGLSHQSQYIVFILIRGRPKMMRYCSTQP